MNNELKAKLFTNGKDSYSIITIIFENIAFILNWSLAFYLLMPFKFHGISLLSFIYLLILIVVQILLKKHNCTSCFYYDKWCHLGWGKLSSFLFKQDSGNVIIGMRLSFSYILQLPVILIASIVLGFVYGFTTIYIIAIIIFVIINILQVINRKRVCNTCKSRFICSGSAAKKQGL
ncbi:MAG: hypothetical protein DRJ01_09405 [Bacteroidetes bacterium]|nr:MAG: hypothetical protein DRJ01_09405 [Bacteroidota bacterium]